MTKLDFVKAVEEKTGFNKNDIKAIIDAEIEVAKETLKKGEPIQMASFGTFDIRNRAARVGRVPMTGELVDIPACKIVRFKAAKQLKDAVN